MTSDFAQIVDALGRDGFLCDRMPTVIEDITAEHAPWFAYARWLNRIALAVHADATAALPGEALKSARALATQLLPRMLAAFQGAIILAERGMSAESLTLSRGNFEAAFWIGYFAHLPNEAAAHFTSDSLKSLIGLDKAFLDHGSLSPAERVQITKRRDSRMKERAALDLEPLDISGLAKKAGMAADYIHYKLLCADSAHATMLSVFNYLNIGEDGEVVGHQIGPDGEQARRAVITACDPIQSAITAFKTITPSAVPPERWAEYEAGLDYLATKGAI